MESGNHSYMAEGSAYLRAVHMSVDGEPKVLNDPLAATLLGSDLDDKIAADRERLARPELIKARSLIIMRSRYAEDELAAAIDRDIKQYVVLGAGLDTSPYRGGHPAQQIQTFEVDHPDTQRWKLERLRSAGVQIRDNLQHVAVDFETDSLAERLTTCGFSHDEPTFFSWLGVSYYLNQESVLDIFRFVASLPAPSQLVFDFVMGDSELNETERNAMTKITTFVEKYGEPWLCRFGPNDLQKTLHNIGFGTTFYFSHEQATRRYFENRPDGLFLDFTTQMMSAIV
ncbi:MAG: SAM-dependent methyltransferase [Gammaproteobacteria bacterium]|jgi:methyltransferase (TIGR00027 family)|nr:SAM-dependent methyltransferase [Chromatiales bacterium]MDP6674491.1 SAM-dependent methyltransferase [Gammaproteobacteria bacterium]